MKNTIILPRFERFETRIHLLSIYQPECHLKNEPASRANAFYREVETSIKVWTFNDQVGYPASKNRHLVAAASRLKEDLIVTLYLKSSAPCKNTIAKTLA